MDAVLFKLNVISLVPFGIILSSSISLWCCLGEFTHGCFLHSKREKVSCVVGSLSFISRKNWKLISIFAIWDEKVCISTPWSSLVVNMTKKKKAGLHLPMEINESERARGDYFISRHHIILLDLGLMEMYVLIYHPLLPASHISAKLQKQRTIFLSFALLFIFLLLLLVCRMT